MEKDHKERFWEIDFLRGVAVFTMLAYHFVFDLDFLDIVQVDVLNGFWWLLARTTAIIFIVLVGVSLTISHARALRHQPQQESKVFVSLFPKYLLRGAKIFACGMLITLATWLFSPEWTIWFGILHFIGIAILLSYPFLNLGIIFSLIASSLIISGGLIIKTISLDSYLLLPLGIVPDRFQSFDYFPLLPWYGVMLIGVVFGKHFYPHGKLRFEISNKTPSSVLKKLAGLFGSMGRHSLLIYLIHQPALLAVIMLFLWASR